MANPPSPTTAFGYTVFLRRAYFLAAPAVTTLGLCRPALAAPTQEDVFRSIQHNVGGGSGPPGSGDIDPMTFLLVLVGLIVLIVLISLATRQKGKATAAPKVRNHQGKLLREVLKSVPIKSKELKQLKLMADHADASGPAVSPLTLLLCPSVMARTIQQGPGKRMKFDRRALVSVARKAGLQVAKR